MAERVFEMLWDCAYCGTRKLGSPDCKSLRRVAGS